MRICKRNRPFKKQEPLPLKFEWIEMEIAKNREEYGLIKTDLSKKKSGIKNLKTFFISDLKPLIPSSVQVFHVSSPFSFTSIQSCIVPVSPDVCPILADIYNVTVSCLSTGSLSSIQLANKESTISNIA